MIELSKYQKEAVKFLSPKYGGILADEPGVGKTFPALSAARQNKPYLGEELPVLLVVPAYLIPQTYEVLTAYLSQFSDGNKEVICLYRNSQPLPERFQGWVITSYHTLMNQGWQKRPDLQSTLWAVVIFDEAHRLRGRSTQWTQNARKLQSYRKWALTGSPIVKDPGDVWPILHMFDRKKFSSYWKFVRYWCETETTPWSEKIGGVKPGMEDAFNDMLSEYMLRRTLADVIEEERLSNGLLPAWLEEPNEQFLYVDLAPAVKATYKQAAKDWFIENPDLDDPVAIKNGGSLVIKLRQLTSGYVVDEGVAQRLPSEKLATVRGLVEDHEREPLLIFTYYVETAKQLAEDLRRSRTVFLSHGGISTKERAIRIDHWQQSPDGVIITTLETLKEGANLQHANTVIFVEHDYLPATLEQAIARVKRRGQKQRVNIYHVLTRGTIDVAVHKVMQTRSDNIAKALLEYVKEDVYGSSIQTR